MSDEVGEVEPSVPVERIEHINFGFPDTVLPLLTGFDLTEISPLTGEVVDIKIDDDAEFIDWMMACEFLMKKTAQLSSAGYEKALELLCKGSMDYKIIAQEFPPLKD